MNAVIRDQDTFTKGNLKGRWVTPDLYVVYSYGEHWPLAAWLPWEQWYVNTERNSATTNRHCNQVMAALCGRNVSNIGKSELIANIERWKRGEGMVNVTDKQADLFEVSM